MTSAAVGTSVLRAHGDVTSDFLTAVLRDQGWIGDATVVDAPAETVGAGLMGICARYQLRLDRDVPGAPAQRRRQVRRPGRNRARVHGVERLPERALLLPALRVTRLDPRATLRVRRHRRRRLVHAHPRRLRAHGAGRPAARLHRRTGRSGRPRARRPPRTVLGRRRAPHPRVLHRSWQRRARAAGGGLQAVVPGFIGRYGAAFAPDEVAFYERFGNVAGNWFAARTTPRIVRAQRLPARQPALLRRRGRADGRGRRLAGLPTRAAGCRTSRS